LEINRHKSRKIKRKKNLSDEDLVLWDLFTKNLVKNIKSRKFFNIKKKYSLKKKSEQLNFGEESGLTKKKFRKIKRGNIRFEAKLDLHGFTEIEAKSELELFLNNSISQNKRFVLVITGKGREQKGGVIKNNISKWLNGKNLKPKILGFDYAAPKHGGTGAIYVFLKKF